MALVWHAEEWLVIDKEDKFVGRYVVVEGDLPLQLVVLHKEGENTRLRKFFAKKICESGEIRKV